MSAVAIAILEQLGGSVFVAATGARNITMTEYSLIFKLPAHFSEDGVNHVVVFLTPSRTYNMTFGKMQDFEYAAISRHENVSTGELRGLFTKITGLDTSFGRRRA
jgi:hypothetical protein